MKRVISILGGPGTGKTTLVKQLKDRISPHWEFHSDVKLVPFYKFKMVYILGVYDGEGYAQGTDKMSMACQPEVVKWIESLPDDSVIILEGDRLGNMKFLDHCNDKYDTTVYLVKVSDEERARRFAARGSDQDPIFIKGRETKYNNIASSFMLMDIIVHCPNETEQDREETIHKIPVNIATKIAGYTSAN